VKQKPKKQILKFAEKKRSKVKLNIMTEQFTTTKIPQLLQRKLIAEIFSCCDQYQQV